MKPKGKIIMIRGNSGSGKTSLAKALQASIGPGTLLLSQDMLRREMLFVSDGPDTQTISFFIHLLKYGQEQNQWVIVEGILHAEWYKSVFEFIQNHYETIFAYYYDLSFEETVKRHQTRAKNQDFGVDTMRRWWLEQDFLPQMKESILNEAVSLEEALEIILTDIGYTGAFNEK